MSTDTQNKDDEKIVVNEGQDGSAVIELPDHIQGDDRDEDDNDDSHAEGGEVDASGDEVAPADETDYQRARREKRRAKRELAKRSRRREGREAPDARAQKPRADGAAHGRGEEAPRFRSGPARQGH